MYLPAQAIHREQARRPTCIRICALTFRNAWRPRQIDLDLFPFLLSSRHFYPIGVQSDYSEREKSCALPFLESREDAQQKNLHAINTRKKSVLCGCPSVPVGMSERSCSCALVSPYILVDPCTSVHPARRHLAYKTYVVSFLWIQIQLYNYALMRGLQRSNAYIYVSGRSICLSICLPTYLFLFPTYIRQYVRMVRTDTFSLDTRSPSHLYLSLSLGLSLDISLASPAQALHEHRET